MKLLNLLRHKQEYNEIQNNPKLASKFTLNDEGYYSNIINTYSDIKNRLIEKVIPFAEDSFGNMICNYSKKVFKIIIWFYAIRFSCFSYTQ